MAVRTVLGASLFGLAHCEPVLLPDDTPAADYSMLKTQGFQTVNGLPETLTGDVLVQAKTLPATMLDINMIGVDEYCPDNRSSPYLPANGCSIFVTTGTCDSINADQQALFNTNATIINPWRKANYGYAQGGNQSIVQMKVLAGTALEQAELANTVVIAHDSSGEALACGALVGTTATLAGVTGYSGNVKFVSGTVEVSTEQRQVLDLSNAAEGLHGLDEKCTVDFRSTDNQLQPANTATEAYACGISIHEDTDCATAPQSPTAWNDKAEGQQDPWKDVRYAVVDAPVNGSTNSGEVKAKQPVFAGESLAELKGKAVVMRDSTGAAVACSTLRPFGELPSSTTTTTTVAAESSSIPWWGILLICLGVAALLGGLAALFLCGGSKKRSIKKKSSKKRATQVEEAPAPPPAPEPSQPMQMYATPVYTTVHHAIPTASVAYAAPPVTYAAPAATYSAVPTYAHPVATYAQQPAVATYAHPAATYSAPAVATYAQQPAYANYAPGGSVMMQ